MKKISLILGLTFLWMTQHVVAQEIKSISKQEVIAKVKENNHTLKIAKENTLVAKGDYKQSNAVFLPNISVSHAAMSTTNPLMAFGFKLNQEILVESDFNPAFLNDPRKINDFATKIEIQQPILNFDGFHQRKAAKAKLNATMLQSERTEDYINLEVQKAYMQLQLAYKTVHVLEKAQITALENKRIATDNLKQGYLQKPDVLAVEVRVTEIDNQLQYAKSNILNASNYLSVLMNDTTYELLKPSDSLAVDPSTISLDELSENRKDIKAMQAATIAHQEMYKADKMSFMPRLNAFGTYELHDDDIFKGDAKGYLIGAELRWSIFEGSKRSGKLQKSKAEYEKSKFELEQYKATSKMGLYKAQRDFQDAINNLQLSRLGLEQSSEALRIRTNRFKQGLEKTTDLLMSETQYAQKQLEYYGAIFKHNYALAYVQFLTKK